MVTALDPINARSYASALLLLQLQLANSVDVARQQKVLNASLNQEINSINLEGDKWRSLKTDLWDSVNFIQEAVTRTESIASRLESMSLTAYTAKNGDTHSSWTYPIQFDVQLRGINSTAIDSRKTPNLLSTNDSNYTYIKNIYGATETVDREFLGTSYTITDSGGDIWVRDRNSNILRQWDGNTYTKTGKFAALTGGIRLDSIVGTSVTFTINYNSTDALQFTGTLSTSGLGVLDAWLYEDLTTAAGRTRALADVHEAQAQIDAHTARLKGELAIANYHLGRSQVQIGANRDLVDAATASHLLKLQEVEQSNATQNAYNALIVQGANAVRDQYFNLLSLSYGNGLARALINILA